MEPLNDKRPWGEFRQFTRNEPTTVKLITVEPHQELSLQYHKNRKEFWRILSGSGIIQIGDEKIPAQKGDEFVIEAEQNHRISAGAKQIVFLEIAFGDFDENDIVRIEDKYGRDSTPKG